MNSIEDNRNAFSTILGELELANQAIARLREDYSTNRDLPKSDEKSEVQTMT